MANQVENAVVPLLPHGQARISAIAAELGVSRRTLARRLAAEGLAFRKVLDELRFDLAKGYLREEDLPISEVAWLLGYRETSALNHAFKRWTGSAPKRRGPIPRGRVPITPPGRQDVLAARSAKRAR